MKSTTGRAALALVVTAALTGAAACTSDGRPEQDRTAAPASLAALRTAERSTGRADSARVRSTTVLGDQLSLTAVGALRWGHGLTGTLTITYTGGTTAETMRELGVTSMEARYLPDAFYAHMGQAFAGQAGGGKRWLKYAYDDLAAMGTGADFAAQLRSTTPNQSVRLLLDSDDVQEVGEEIVEGRRTTHYSGTVEVADVADAGLRAHLEQAGVTAETVDIWVDAKDLLVKKVEKGETAHGGYSQTAYYSDYGTEVTTQAPPAGDTADFSELLRQQGGAPTP
ncbi:hypothetical protein [Streptomyces sp. A012304]|uniref:hypothetical protein n=1 Tax=Streptomyces sp. A012304 TaxID=375446 RepID=UPI0022317A9A|nr:hypothetical protein [Streptomyces sp. A012304]GKQ35671.1 putative lipoprotein [Streptomyces sp. A012304]